MNKNQCMVEFLQTCPTIRENPLFFNFGNVEDNANQVNINSDDVALNKPYVDGSVLKRYTCYVDSFRSVACIPVIAGKPDENIEDLTAVQEILNWINERGANSNFPDFGDTSVIEKMETTSDKPALVGVESNLNPPVAIYRIGIRIDYIDQSGKLWK